MDKYVKVISSNDKKDDNHDKIIVTDRDDALIELYPHFMSKKEATELFKELEKIEGWKVRQVVTKGGMQFASRLIASLVNPSTDKTIMHYNPEDNDYSFFTPLLEKVHDRIKDLTHESFNYAYLNFYRDGNDYIGFHSDKEDNIEQGSTIASLSLGATRDFVIRHIADTRIAQAMLDNESRLAALEAAKQSITLENGSLLLMKKSTQKVYHHGVPKRTKIMNSRINITFRHVKEV